MVHPGVAQLVARLTGGQEAVGSSPATRTKIPLKSCDFNGIFFIFITSAPLKFCCFAIGAVHFPSDRGGEHDGVVGNEPFLHRLVQALPEHGVEPTDGAGAEAYVGHALMLLQPA